MRTTLEAEGLYYVLLVERRLAHPATKVWRAVTELDQLASWFPARVEGEWVVGSPLQFTMVIGDGGGLPEEALRGQVLAVEEPRLLEFRWGDHAMRFEIEAEGDGCLFRLSERFEDPSWAARNAAGWEMCIENLDLILEGASALKFMAEVWRTKFRHYVGKFEPEFGLQSDPSDHDPLLEEDGETGS
jgi:uncharacterized protein YndB with AHSA1/START domain